MRDTFASIRIKDIFMRGKTGDELPKGSLPSMKDDCCVRADSIPSNCLDCTYGAGGHSDAERVCCGHPDKPSDVYTVMTRAFASRCRAPWCPMTVGRFENGVNV